MLTATACGFQGLNSLPLPGAAGRGPDAAIYHVEISNVGTLEQNSPVMVDDVVVGSVAKMRVKGWHADVEVSVRPEVQIPANVQARVGQTSLLGSMHVALDPPLGQAPQGRLLPGATIPMSQASAFPSTERTLSTLSTVVNSGGLGQIGDIIHSFNAALRGRVPEARNLLTRLDRFIGVFDDQRADVIASIEALDRLSGALVAQRDVVRQALDEIPPALDVLVAQRPQFTTALDRLRAFSQTTVGVVNDTQTDLVATLSNLEPTVRALADVGPDIDTALAFLPVMPFGQNLIDRGIRGDYMNLFAVFDLTVPRLKRTLLSGTRWGDPHALLVPAPGDPGYDAFYANPLNAPLASPPPAPAADPTAPEPAPAPGEPPPADAAVPSSGGR
ncbi:MULTISPECIES: MCE family protein [unclassified Mycobacterium]|uniref:MCE family protein n=1 Tax=unclassified Mycobacterium TaxID=2642494 RepID=UPI00073FCE22|nr:MULTISPECIES: MCE family protein [unclassified Mycobacterium]KUH83091.1 mammalian cell entry protein [Mycobacterium sp. IS-1556]KUH83436.1 mammalian cell entry protein [Mycobacterium sp. GA-0227b]KUH84499.1 mammalian cell entry protein [Mycobacterium sp. GA-1999]